jgi:hypothetical protein
LLPLPSSLCPLASLADSRESPSYIASAWLPMARSASLAIVRYEGSAEHNIGEPFTMTNANKISGRTIRLNWTEGPTKGQAHDHLFHDNGTVEWHAADATKKPSNQDTASEGKPRKAAEKVPYAATQVSKDVAVFSYKSGADFTLTAVLNFVDYGVTGFASGGKDWFPVAGTFEIVA